MFRKTSLILILLLILIHVMPVAMQSASAEVLTVETDLTDTLSYTYMLRSGDTLHCLTISSHVKVTNGLAEIALSMAAQCSTLESSVFVPCQDHCADRFHDRIIQNASTTVIPTRGFFDIVISPQNQTYLIDGDWAVYQWMPEDEEPWYYLCTLDTSLFDFENYVTWKTFTTDGETLYGCFLEGINDDTAKGASFSFSLTSGACESLPLQPSTHKVYPVDGQRLLYEGDSNTRTTYGFITCYYLYDIETGKETLFTDEAIWTLVPDGEGGWYSLNPVRNAYQLYHYDEEGGEGEMIAQLPEGLSEARFSLSEDLSTVYICSWDGMFVVYSLISGDSAPSNLVLVGSLNEYNNSRAVPDLFEFSLANGGAQITTVAYPASYDDFALELVSGSDRFDLMALELSAGNVGSLLDKGYYVDLSGNENIAAYVQNLYPTWQKECVRDGKIVGIPVNLRGLWTFVVNLDLWNEMDLGTLPRTYDELFEYIEEWERMGVLEEVPLFDYHGTSAFERLFHRIMIDFMGKCQREGRSITFSDETLLDLLSRLEEVRPILEAHDAKNMTGDGLLFEGELSGIVRTGYFGKLEVTADNSTFEALPLGLTDAADCTESVIFTLLVINPKSQNRELAEAYLAYLAEHPTTWTRCCMLKDGPMGVREKGFEDLDEQYERLAAELDEKIAAAMKDSNDAVLKRWEQEKRELVDNYLNQWEVRPNMAAMFYRMMPYFTPLTSDGYGFLINRCDDLTQMFLEGRLDYRSYAMRLDERMWMAEMEGSN